MLHSAWILPTAVVETFTDAQIFPLIPFLSLATTMSFAESAQINVSHLINAKGENNLTLIRQQTTHPGLAACA